MQHYDVLLKNKNTLEQSLHRKITLIQSNTLITKQLSQLEKNHPDLFPIADKNNNPESSLTTALQNIPLSITKIIPDHVKSKNKNRIFLLTLSGSYVSLLNFIKSLNTLSYAFTITHLTMTNKNDITLKIETPE